jgi:HAD superfamily hydrolase (TIGR01509 family)
MRRRPDLAHDLTAVRLFSLGMLLRKFGYAEELARPAMAVFLEARNAVTPYLDVLPALNALRRRYRLVSLTNGNAEVACTPLRHCFELNLTAGRVGAAKPKPDIFLRALGHADVAPWRALHVGDDPELDVRAARRVGMRTAWVNRTGGAWPRELEPPDVRVGNLHELKEWLRADPSQWAT